MANYKYPFIPKEYYPAVMYACSCIRKYGTFNVAVNTAAKAYGVDSEMVAKYVRERQGAGQKGAKREYSFFVVVGWLDRWINGYDLDILWSQYEPNEWKEQRKQVAIVIKATDKDNAKKKIPNGKMDRYGRISGDVIRDYEIIEFKTEKEANAYIDSISIGGK